MSSPFEEEEEEEVPDLQPTFVFGNTVVKPQTPYTLPRDAESQEDYSTERLSLSRSHLKHVEDSILRNSGLKYLYLEGNQISSIPESMFFNLPNLLWLDLRKNQVASLPAEIGSHRCLKTLLLEGNPISELPPELGNVITLKGLNLRNCPISFPPRDIVDQGLQSILQFLRVAMAMRPVNDRRTPPEFPVVERLQLVDVMGSCMEEQDELEDEGELQKFEELKDKMILLDKAELGSLALGGDGVPKSHVIFISKRKKPPTTKAGKIPELRLYDTKHWKKPEERTQAATKELKEKQAIIEQRKRSQDALRKWRIQAKITEEKKLSERKQKMQERQKEQEDLETDSKPVMGEGSDTIIHAPHMPIKESEESRSARELERQIRARVERMQERRRNPQGTATEQMAAAEHDVDEVRKLQTRLLEKKRNRGKDLENSFTIFTGDTWPSFVDQ